MTKRWLLCATTAAVLMATPALAANDAAPGGDAAKTGGAAQNSDAVTSGGAVKGTNGAQQAIDKALKDRDTSQAASGAALDQGAGSDSAVSEAHGDRPKGERAMAQRRLRRALKEAGFTDVRILGATYRIRARDDNGNTVFLRINPRSMDRHAMNKHDMSDNMRRGMGQETGKQGMADDDDDMASGDMNRGGMDQSGMDQDGARSGETTGAGEGGSAYGAGPMESRGAAGGYGHRWPDGTPSAYDRAYNEGFRDGFSRGFDRAHGWR